MQPYQDFSSWQPEQERQFVVFEQRSVEASKRAWAIGLFVAFAFGIAMIGVAVAVPADDSRIEAAAADGPDLPAEIAPAATRPQPEQAPAAAPAQSAAPAAPAAAPAPAGQDQLGAETGAAPAAGSDPSTAAPTPPPGTTKAPPTDLVKGQK
jgi:hypothetical protein